MGKQKRERTKPHKSNPTGLPSIRDFDEEEQENVVNEDRDVALQRVYEDVQSPNIEDKISGLQTLESMSSDIGLAVQIANDGIAKKIGPLLLDPSVPVRTNTASALRYIAAGGKEEAVEYLIRDDVMTPLSAFLQKYHIEWQPSAEHNEKGKINDEREAFVQTVTLLWTLCERNEAVVKRANEQNLALILVKFLDINTYGVETATATAQCLLSLSEDNPTALEKLATCEQVFLDLLGLDTNADNNLDIMSLKTPVAGILINMTNSEECSSVNTVCKIATVLSDVLTIKQEELLSKLVSIIPHEKNNFSRTAKKRVQESRRYLGAQQQALELLANLCSQDQGDSNSDSDDSEMEDIMEDDVNDAPMDDKCDTDSILPLELVEVFSSREILQKVWEKTKAVDKDTQEILEQNVEGKSVLKQICTLRCRAYLCLNNLLSALEIDTLGGIEAVHRLWVEIGAVVFKDTDTNDFELLEAAIAAVAAAIQKLVQTKTTEFERLLTAITDPVLTTNSNSNPCVQFITVVGTMITNLSLSHGLPRAVENIRASIRAKLYRILGNITILLINSNSQNLPVIMQHVSQFVLDASKSEPEAWVMAEALDVIMDMYAEDDSDQVAKAIELVPKLQSLVPIFKNKARIQRKRLGDHMAIVSTVNANINRFIKYKEKRIKRIS